MIFLQRQTLTELFREAVIRYDGNPCFQMYGGGEMRGRLSYRDFGEKTRQLALLFTRLGVKRGDRIMLMAENCPEWPVAWFAAALAGAVTVPVLADFSAGQTEAIAVHSGASVICYTGRTASKVESAGRNAHKIRIDEPDYIKAGIRMDKKENFCEDDFPPVNEDDPAAIIYTSGTTGGSKGVLLSHKNLLFIAAASRASMKIFSSDRFLSVIPLAHTYECSVGMLIAFMSGASVTYLDRPPSPAVLLPAMRALKPTVMLTVPLLMEKICRNKIFPSLRKSPFFKFPLTRALAVSFAGHKLKAAMGSSIRFFGIGGAQLSEEVERFLKKSRFPYVSGYGLTETAPLVTGNSPRKFPLGSAGKVLAGTEARIASEGEIQVRGPNVMLGYYKDEERTKAAFTKDGWFKTGDIGRLDKQGYLYITGRLKNLILGPSGENIYPEEIESILETSGLIEDALVIPGKKGELVALIVPSEKAKNMFAALGGSLEELKNSVNKKLAAFSRLSRIEIQSVPFEKTPTQKIKRFLYAAT